MTGSAPSGTFLHIPALGGALILIFFQVTWILVFLVSSNELLIAWNLSLLGSSKESWSPSIALGLSLLDGSSSIKEEI